MRALLIVLVLAAGARAEEKRRVHVESTRPNTVIERMVNRQMGFALTFPPVYTYNEQWETACVAPCEVQLDPNAIYRVSGGRVAASHRFLLPPGDPLWVHVKAGSQSEHIAGIAMEILGLASMAAGAGVALGLTDVPVAHSTGWTVLGAGALQVIIGAILLVHARTRVWANGRRLN